MRQIMNELMEELDGVIKDTLNAFVKSHEWSLDDYLEAVDQGDLTEWITETCLVTFASDHTVTLRVDVSAPSGYSWAFKTPFNLFVEVEVGGTFEELLT